MSKQKKAPNRVCDWKADDDGVYDTSCDQRFFFDSGTVAENNFTWCPYCGNRLREHLNGK